MILQTRSIRLFLLTSCFLMPVSSVGALPPPDDPPEEVLRTEIILDARSPIDGQPVSAAEYAELEAQLRQGQPGPPPPVPAQLREKISLLKLRKFLKTFFPFLPVP